MSLVRALWPVLAVAGMALPADAGEVRRLLLAAGSNNGGVDRELLRYAVSDAESFVQVLQEMGGLHPEDVLLLRDPDVAGFEQGLSELGRRVRAASRRGDRLEVLVYYSGHADAGGLLLAGDRLEYPVLRGALESAPANVHIAVLDACASGAITRTKGGRRRPPFLVDESFDMEGYAFLTSSSAGEAAQESDLLQASFFTHYLVSGLRGAADGDGDGRVTLSEAYRFTFNETRARTTGTAGGIQHPAYEVEMRGTGGVVMTDVRRKAAGLLLDEDLSGRLYVRNPGQRIVAELNKTAGRAVELGVEPGSYALYLQRGSADWHLAERVLAEGEFAEVKAGDFQALTPEHTGLRGGSRRGLTLGMNEDRQIEVVTGEGRTLTMGLLTNSQDEPFQGIQLGWLASLARERTGSQASWLGNLALKEVDGWQATIWGVNWAVGPLQGGQAGPINLASQVRGWQVASEINVADRIRGGQLAIWNVAGEVTGVQIGAMNTSSRVQGWQVGMINIAGRIDGGLPIGLINYSHGGTLGFSTWRDDLGFNLLTVASGGRWYHTSFTTGFARRAGPRLWAIGPGIGVRKSGRRFSLGLDLHGYRISRDLGEDYDAHIDFWPFEADVYGVSSTTDNSLLRVRLETGVVLAREAPLFGRPSLFAGVSLNRWSTEGHPRLIESGSRFEKEREDGVFVWPGYFIGLRYGR
ncbi:MAG: caspase family protein [Gemmatimonadaceae bacterium]|nr:caspase family protein [Gemmatimonadaceae bacterium]